MSSTPYLQLKDRISQAWLNKYTILLTLIALKLLLFQQSLNSSLNTSKLYTLESCPTIDSYVSNLVSFPHYIAKSSNFLILKTIEEINEKTLETLGLIVTGTENIIIFALEMIVGTYACVLVSTIDGAVDVAVNSTESIIGWVNNTLGNITDDIEDGLTDISKFLNKAVNAAEKVKDFFDGDDDNQGNSSLSHINLTVSSLRKLHIPSSINTKLDSLKNHTPNFDQVKNKTENLVRTPFELIKDKLSNTTVMSTKNDTLYVPELAQVTICSDNSDKINEFYDHLAKDIRIMVKIFVILLILGALIALIPIIYQEFRLWTKLKSLELDNNTKDPIEMFEKTFNKYPTALGSFASKTVTNDPNSQISIRWLVSYVLSSRAIILLGIALAGILAVCLQFIILKILTKSISKNMTSFNEITNEITSKIDDSITTWTDSTNDYLQQKQDSINDDVFSWVKIATDGVNDTISSFVTEMNEAISDAFNGTILYAPVKTIVGCVIEDKLIKIEKGLTWIHDHAEITLPRVDDDYLTQAWNNNDTSTGGGGDVMGKASNMIDQTENLMKKMLKTLIEQYKKSLKFELYISLALLGLWGLQFIIGLIILYFKNSAPIWGGGLKQNEKLNISYPKELTKEEQQLYGYPLTGNLKVMNLNPFNDSNVIKNPFQDPSKVDEKLDIENDSKSTLTTEKLHTVINPFDEFESESMSRVLTRFDDDEENDLTFNGKRNDW